MCFCDIPEFILITFPHFELSHFLQLINIMCIDNWYLVEATSLKVVDFKSTSSCLFEL